MANTMIIDHKPVIFEDPDERYFSSPVGSVPDVPHDIRIARDDAGAIVAAYGSPFESYRSWMEMALGYELYDLATDEVVEMAKAEDLVARFALPVPPVQPQPRPPRPVPGEPGVPTGA
jgi:hypothetical protein